MSKKSGGGRVTPPGDRARQRVVKDLAELDVDIPVVFQFLSERGVAEWNAAVHKARVQMLAERLADAEALLRQMPDLAAERDAAPPAVHHDYPGDPEPTAAPSPVEGFDMVDDAPPDAQGSPSPPSLSAVADPTPVEAAVEATA